MTDSQTLPTDRQTHSEIDLAKTNTKTTRPFEDEGKLLDCLSPYSHLILPLDIRTLGDHYILLYHRTSFLSLKLIWVVGKVG